MLLGLANVSALLLAAAESKAMEGVSWLLSAGVVLSSAAAAVACGSEGVSSSSVIAAVMTL